MRLGRISPTCFINAVAVGDPGLFPFDVEDRVGADLGA